uniref:Ribosomal RNA methyltransferase FtsJ domain-containing protein n=1 Tax=viral metagenome TaxID=1070528 RepID=A0A6C0DGS2_9ZZZZ
MAIVIEKPPWISVEWNSKSTLLIPDLSNEVWTYTMTPEEEALHLLRKRINKYETDEGMSDWEYYKKIVNPYELIYTQKKYTNFPESVCLLHPLSRSYFKLIEILSITNFYDQFVKNKAQHVRSAHVCEGPGGFIEAFIDQCSKYRIENYSSSAITLRPKQANVPGWKRAATFLKKNRNIKIVYGPDDTGDILNYANQNAFIEECSKKVHVFTGDGGFDFSMDYDSQEQTIFSLLVVSVRIGFEVLQHGGLFVLKFFDIYHSKTQELIQLLSGHFIKWTLYKPATSRPCNPEIYFVGNKFCPPSPSVLNMLRSWSKSLCETAVATSVVEANSSSSEAISVQATNTIITPNPYILKTIASSVRKQTSYLEKVFSLIEEDDAAKKTGAITKQLKDHEIISYHWCKHFSVPIYLERHRSIEALHTYLQVVDPP